MPKAYLSLGSNQEPETHLAAAVQALAQRNPGAARQAMHTHFANGLAAAKNQPLPAA